MSANGRKSTSVGVCLIAGDMMHTKTAIDLLMAANYASEGCGLNLTVNNHRGSVLAEARQSCIKRALEQGADWIFSVDSDMRIPVNVIPGMIAHDVDVVAANCAKRKRPIGPTARRKNAAFNGGESDAVFPDPNVTGLEQVETVGFGVIMIRASVFKRIEWPWFGQPWNDHGPGRHTGEDIFFCARLKEAGIPLYIDHDLSWAVRHIGEYEYSMQDVLAEKRLAESGAWEGV